MNLKEHLIRGDSIRDLFLSQLFEDPLDFAIDFDRVTFSHKPSPKKAGDFFAEVSRLGLLSQILGGGKNRSSHGLSQGTHTGNLNLQVAIWLLLTRG